MPGLEEDIYEIKPTRTQPNPSGAKVFFRTRDFHAPTEATRWSLLCIMSNSIYLSRLQKQQNHHSASFN